MTQGIPGKTQLPNRHNKLPLQVREVDGRERDHESSSLFPLSDKALGLGTMARVLNDLIQVEPMAYLAALELSKSRSIDD